MNELTGEVYCVLQENAADKEMADQEIDKLEMPFRKSSGLADEDPSAILSRASKQVHVFNIITDDEHAMAISREEKSFSFKDSMQYIAKSLNSIGELSDEDLNKSLLNRDGSATAIASKFFDESFIREGHFDTLAKSNAESNVFVSSVGELVASDSWDYQTDSSTSYDFKIEEDREPEILSRTEAIAKRFGISKDVDLRSYGALEKALKDIGYSLPQIAKILGRTQWIVDEILKHITLPKGFPAAKLSELLNLVFSGMDPGLALQTIVAGMNAEKLELELYNAKMLQ